MKAPHFWKEKGWKAEFLLPLSVIYFLLLRLKYLFTKPQSFPVPIICVGNATAGGTGKTPVAIAIARMMAGKKISFISKGYGGKLQGPIKVDVEKHTAKDIGDEPLLLAKVADCWVGKNRKEAIEAAINAGAKILILDDGLQDKSVNKNLSFMIIDGGYGFGNMFLLPAGPLRDRMDICAKKADIAIIIGQDKNDVSQKLGNYIQVTQADFMSHGKLDNSGKFIAFAGIGLPEKFFDTLKKEGFDVVEKIPFLDHHQFSNKEIEELLRKSEKAEARLITTEKDMVRIDQKFRSKIQTLPVEIKFHDEERIKTLLSQKKII